MPCHNPGCLGNYDFDHIAFFAKKRFIEGYSTIELMEIAKSEQEKEEIVLVCLLDVDNGKIRDLQLSCKHAGQCKTINCRDKLLKMLEGEHE
jgi:hypothetical protein